jgi:Ser/Thr protein kinase RdoA (MazF antagonist)
MMNVKTMVLGISSDSVAEELIQCWEHDEGSLKFWRASSNFVCVFKHNGTAYFLRFAHAQERSLQQISAELDFLQDLHLHAYGATKPIPSKNGNLIESVTTAQGTYYAVVFSQAKGAPLELESMTEKQFAGWGKSLGSLHHLSKSYTPIGQARKSWQDALHFIESVLAEHPQEIDAVVEAQRLNEWLHSLPCHEEQYGLIHYDFEPDNVFWDEESARFCVIDFDDSMYHWYVMDIANALQDLQEFDPETAERNFQAFLTGYRAETTLDQAFVDLLPRFERFANLYKFARVLRSLQDSELSDAPTWVEPLRVKLFNLCAQKRAGFQQPW